MRKDENLFSRCETHMVTNLKRWFASVGNLKPLAQSSRPPSVMLIIFVVLGSVMIPAQAGDANTSILTGGNNMSSTHKSQTKIDQINSSGQTYQAPYSFTADDLWKNLLKVIELPNGHVTKEQVENIFGVTMNLDEVFQQQSKEDRYDYKNEYIYLGYFKSILNKSYFEFRWGQSSGQRRAIFPRPPSGMCIDAFKIMPDITQRGWALKKEIRNVRDILNRNDYRKGKMGILRLEFFPYDNCLFSVDISSSDHADQLIR
jgi:hypothetical protein